MMVAKWSRACRCLPSDRISVKVVAPERAALTSASQAVCFALSRTATTASTRLRTCNFCMMLVM